MVEMEITEERGAAVGMIVRSVAPNPFNSGTALHLTLQEGYADVAIGIYDVAGRRVRTIKKPQLGPGDHTIPWDGRNYQGIQVGSGIYFLKVSATNLPDQFIKTLVIR